MKKRSGIFKNWKSKGRAILIVLLILGLVAASGCSQSATAPTDDQPETVELNLAHFFPATHPAETELIQPWAKAVEEATEGRVKITSHPAQTLLQADGVYDGVVNGIADIGLSCFSYTRGATNHHSPVA